MFQLRDERAINITFELHYTSNLKGELVKMALDFKWCRIQVLAEVIKV